MYSAIAGSSVTACSVQRSVLYLANCLVDQYIGLEETDDGVWAINFNTILLATLDERDFLIRG